MYLWEIFFTPCMLWTVYVNDDEVDAYDCNDEGKE